MKLTRYILHHLSELFPGSNEHKTSRQETHRTSCPNPHSSLSSDSTQKQYEDSVVDQNKTIFTKLFFSPLIFCFLAIALNSLGLMQYVTRELSEEKEARLFHNRTATRENLLTSPRG